MPRGVYQRPIRSPIFPLTNQFWAKVNKDGPILKAELGACWIWSATRSAEGYGQIRFSRKTLYAHRLAYENEYGPIPSGLELDHLCQNRICMRPSHLEAVSHSKNMQRGNIYNRLKTHCIRGHEFTEGNIWWNRFGNRQCRACWSVKRAEIKRG